MKFTQYKLFRNKKKQKRKQKRKKKKKVVSKLDSAIQACEPSAPEAEAGLGNIMKFLNLKN